MESFLQRSDVPPKKKAADLSKKTRSARKVKRKRDEEALKQRQLIQEHQREYQYRLAHPESGFFMPNEGHSPIEGLWGGLLPEVTLTVSEPKPIEEVKIEPLVKLEPATEDDGAESTAASVKVKTEVKVEPCDSEENPEVLAGQVDSVTAASSELLLERGYKPAVEMWREYKNGRKYRLHQCPYCDYRSHSSGIASHIGMHTNYRQFGCHLCEFKTNYSAALDRHVRRHRGKRKVPVAMKRYECQLCGYVAKYGHHFKSHMLGKHSTDMPFKCSHCEYRARYSRTLRRHIVSQHTPKSDRVEKKLPDKMFQCDHCDYNSPHRRCIMSHLNVHSEKQYKCVFCEYFTKHIRSLRRHTKTVHAAETAIFFASSNTWGSVASENTYNVPIIAASSNNGSSVASGTMDNLNGQGGSVASEKIDYLNNHDEPECILNEKETVESDPLQVNFSVDIKVEIEEE